MTLPLTPSQTVGPYLAVGLTWDDGAHVVPEGTPGALRISGQVFDGAGAVVPDAMVETWQADPQGRFAHPDDPRGSAGASGGFGRCNTDDEGVYSILTLRPGALPVGDGDNEAPHIDVCVFARGLLDRLITRIYLPDELPANAADPVLRELPEESRRSLIAVQEGAGFRFDIHLQGERQTTFFEL